MTRTLSTTIETGVEQPVTQPIHLIRMGWETERRIATWDANITWNAETWTASGAVAQGISQSGGTLILPIGQGLPWVGLQKDERCQGRSIVVYERHTDFTASPIAHDATPIFTGIMDECELTLKGLRIRLIQARKNRKFPPNNIEPPTYNFLLASGQRLFWGPDIITVE